MKLFPWMCGFCACVSAGLVLADGDVQGQLQITSGSIASGTVAEATINSDPPAGAGYKKGDVLKGGTLSAGTVSVGSLRVPQTYAVDAGKVTSVGGGELFGATIKGAKISAGLVGEKKLEDITVDLVEAQIKAASIKSPNISQQDIQAAAQPARVGAIQVGKYTPPADLSGRKITLNQDDSQYAGFRELKADGSTEGPGLYCGKGCTYIVKQDDTKNNLVVNIQSADSTVKGTVTAGKDYLIAKDLQQRLDYSFTGLTFGVLVVPYKWQKADRSITGTASLGPYVGYQTGTSIGEYGVNLIPLVATGITSVSIPNPNSTTSSNATAFSVAAGLAFAITRSQSSLQGGFVCGQDRAGSSTPAPYKYEGRTWCAIEFGYNFTQ
jgi:hypothetical protein